jgi:hypothetical protein
MLSRAQGTPRSRSWVFRVGRIQEEKITWMAEPSEPVDTKIPKLSAVLVAGQHCPSGLGVDVCAQGIEAAMEK